MNWILASLVAALFLGIYELCTKHAVRANAVVPVLFLSSVCSATVWMALMAAGALAPGWLPSGLTTAPLDWWGHLQLGAKSALVASSWMFTYFAMKDLPVSITSPIRATGPIWTIAGALVVLGERPTVLEWLGIGTTLASFVGLSFAGRGEGIRFHRDRAIGFMVAGTLLGAVSSLYDKYLLGTAGFTVPTVQAWFSVYLAVFFLPLAIGWWRRWWPRNEFHWRWSIPCIAAMLLVSDYLYFGALQDRDALVSLVSSLRRGSTLVAFTGGLLLFGEKNGLRKLPAVLGVLTGIVLTVFGRER
ncbi:MAG TPA: DMT family transporter [Opitutaceae bacterium]|nr:DMT family transporter [Opitutaceae bacterium]